MNCKHRYEILLKDAYGWLRTLWITPKSTQVCLSVFVYFFVCICLYVCMSLCVRVYMFFLRVCVCLCVCVSVRTCLHACACTHLKELVGRAVVCGRGGRSGGVVVAPVQLAETVDAVKVTGIQLGQIDIGEV